MAQLTSALQSFFQHSLRLRHPPKTDQRLPRETLCAPKSKLVAGDTVVCDRSLAARKLCFVFGKTLSDGRLGKTEIRKHARRRSFVDQLERYGYPAPSLNRRVFPQPL